MIVFVQMDDVLSEIDAITAKLRTGKLLIECSTLLFVASVLAELETKEEQEKTLEEEKKRIKEGFEKAEKNLTALEKQLNRAEHFNRVISIAMGNALKLEDSSPYMAGLEAMKAQSDLLINKLEDSIKEGETACQSWESLLAKHQRDESE